MVQTSFSDANILNIFSGGSLLPGHTVLKKTGRKTPHYTSFSSMEFHYFFFPLAFCLFMDQSINTKISIILPLMSKENK